MALWNMQTVRYIYTHVHVHLATSTVNLSSPVLRLFQHPVFDRLLYANTEGEGLGNLSTWCHCTWPDLPGLSPP